MMHLKPCTIVHHGGEWVEDGGQMTYNGGRVNTFDDILEDVNSSYVKQVVDSLGYTDIVKLHFLDPRKDFQFGIIYLGFDNSSCDPFLTLLLEFKVIDIYTEHELAHIITLRDQIDDDDVEIVNASLRVTEEKQKEKSYKDELVMLRRLAEEKGKDLLGYASDFDGLSGADNPCESSDEDDCGYLVQLEVKKLNFRKGGCEGSDNKFFVDLLTQQKH
uniref:PB1-like domain-containing protein n=1 Tax=Chenopodium quinoa TaxID=63459 RepID=A0A803MKB3_CHEQI